MDDAISNIEKAKSVCNTLHISSRKGMNEDEMKYIELSIYIYTKQELVSKMEDKKETIKLEKNGNHKKRTSSLAKYKITKVPKWFDDLNKKDDETPVIEIKEETFPQINNNYPNQNEPQDIQIATKFTFGTNHENDNDIQ